MNSVCALLKVVGYHDLSVLSMSVRVPKKMNGGWVGGVSSRPIHGFSKTLILYTVKRLVQADSPSQDVHVLWCNANELKIEWHY